jgi:hypothetical protein
MSRDVLARALEAFRVESEQAEKRPAETLRRILTARQERRRVKPLAWVALLTCSAAAAASIGVVPRLPWQVRIVPISRARPAGGSPPLSPIPVANPSIELNPPSAGPVVPGSMSRIIPAPAPAPALSPVPSLSAARTASASQPSRAQRTAPSPVVSAMESSAQAEPMPVATSSNAEDVLF